MHKLNITVGKKYGNLTVLAHAAKSPHGHIRWTCLCDCGNTVIRRGSFLKGKLNPDCGCYTGKIRHNFINLVGKIFGELTVISWSYKDVRNKQYWLCECSCGTQVIRRSDSLKNVNNHHSCGCYFKSAVRIDRAGNRYGRLTVVKETEKRASSGSIKWECLCDCGNITTVSGNNLKAGTTKSCGCLSLEKSAEQGKANKGEANGMYGLCREKHPNWKGQRTKEDLIRKSDAYAAWRLSIFERDYFTCQKCGTVGGTLNAHHILSFVKHEEDRLTSENGVTLCETCHRAFHSEYSLFNSTKNDFMCFVSKIAKAC